VGEVKARYVDGILHVVLEKSTKKEHGVIQVKVE
jgi:HSP20 family molecular chaperone IbpA